MPSKPLRPCLQPGCPELVEVGRCVHHTKTHRREVASRRSSSPLYNGRWPIERRLFLLAHPLCACDECQSGRIRATPAEVVDHIVPHRDDPALFWDQSNWQPMAKRCHDRKTAVEDGGFGNARANSRRDS